MISRFNKNDTFIDPVILAKAHESTYSYLKRGNQVIVDEISRTDRKLIIDWPSFKELDTDTLRILRGVILYDRLHQNRFFHEKGITNRSLQNLTGRVTENCFRLLLELEILRLQLSERYRIFHADRVVQNQDFLIHDMKSQDWVVGVQCKEYMSYWPRPRKRKSEVYNPWTKIGRKGRQCKRKKQWKSKKFLLMVSKFDSDPVKYNHFFEQVKKREEYDCIFILWGIDKGYDTRIEERDILDYYILNNERMTSLKNLRSFLEKTL